MTMPRPPVNLPSPPGSVLSSMRSTIEAVARLVDLGRAVVGLAVEAAEDRAVAVAAAARAPAAELRLDDGVLPAGIGMDAADEGAADRGEVPGGQPLGHVRREAAPHQVVHPELDLVVEADRRRLLGVEDRAFARQQVDRPERAARWPANTDRSAT